MNASVLKKRTHHDLLLMWTLLLFGQLQWWSWSNMDYDGVGTKPIWQYKINRGQSINTVIGRACFCASWGHLWLADLSWWLTSIFPPRDKSVRHILHKAWLCAYIKYGYSSHFVRGLHKVFAFLQVPHPSHVHPSASSFILSCSCFIDRCHLREWLLVNRCNH